jgi:hypothetical protein
MASHKAVVVDTLEYDPLAWQVRFCRGCRLQPWQLWERRGGAWSLVRVYEQYSYAIGALGGIRERLNRRSRRETRETGTGTGTAA